MNFEIIIYNFYIENYYTKFSLEDVVLGINTNLKSAL